jgi:flagellar motility protein MotE (MotC chaperone)
MGAINRFLLPLIGYLATATVITAALLFFYLWHTEQLTDDKMFRIVALVQGVDLQQLAEEQNKSDEEVPPEEASLDNLAGQQQVLDRNFEVKQLALQRGRNEYDTRLQLLKEQTERYDRLARQHLDRLKQEAELTTQENVTKVVSTLEQVKPATAKKLLLQWIDEDRMSDVITLLGRMSENKKGKILNSFSTDEELAKLHEILNQMIDGTVEKEKLTKAVSELESVKGSGG